MTARATGAAGLVDRVRHRLAADAAEVTPAVVADAVRAEAGGVVADLDLLAALRELQQEFTGAGPLEPLLRDPATTDVLVVGAERVWVERGDGLRRAPVRFADDDAVRRLAQRLAVAAGRRLDDAVPYVDARLPDGTRLHAVLPPVAVDGTSVSLRVLRPASHDLDALRGLGTVDGPTADLLRAVVAARLAFLVVGGTGSGKPTIEAAIVAALAPASSAASCSGISSSA